MAAPSLLLAALLASTPATDLFERSTPAVRGLARLRGDRWERLVPPLRLADGGVWTLYASPDALWIGSESGLLRFQGGAWTLFDRARGLPDDRVRSLLETRERGGRKLWIGTE